MGPYRAISWKKCIDALISEIYTALQFVDEQKRDDVNQEWARAADVGFGVYLFQEVVVKYENLNKRTKNAGAEDDTTDCTRALAVRKSIPNYYQVLWSAEMTQDQYNNPDKLMDKCRAMAGKTNCNSFATVSHLEPNPVVAAAIRETGEFKSANYIGGTGNPPLNHGGRGGRGGNVGKGKGGGFHRGY
uniref:Uncharacterized protein n=1 Tax=Chromera velia CCMP2878 TaxID=1169474 RepID=A0A0G4HDN8_9ALVE|eukprot:Cvel_26529.t1-p1 / transcript=Cvel_26529.t1 / gene=Cvel_26529 / organism=Chromera_velia_CCMP2878 / gene_product=hypothetical protein / transcript_product=hypothetical protein / location=Cvel_scaffold3170:14706-15266(+) / protein_length=187 / sequence_SO=supercontig / SO=protein_coding / is_pseudo=false